MREGYMEYRVKKSIKELVIWGVMGIVLLILAAFFIKNINNIHYTSDQQMRNYVKEVVSQIKNNVNTQLDASKEELISLKSAVFALSEDNRASYLKRREADSSFSELLLFENLQATKTWIRSTFHMDHVLDETLLRNKKVQVLAVPHENKVMSIVLESDYTNSQVLVGISTDEELIDLLSSNTVDSKWNVYPITKEAIVITEPTNITIHELLLKKYEISDADVETIKEQYKNHESSLVIFKDKENKKQIFYHIALDQEDWYLGVVVPYSQVHTKISNLAFNNLLIMLVMLVICVAVIGYLAWIKRKTANKLSSVAFIDKVTNANNNTYFQMEAQRIIRENDTSYYLVSMDICDFKVINNVYGLDAGNKTLCYVYNKVKEVLEDDERVARGSADIFYILLKAKDAKAIITRLHQIYQSINTFLLNREYVYYLELRFGVYHVYDRKVSIEEMEECANIARKSNQREEKFSYAFYDESYLKRQLEEKALVSAMVTSLEQGHFEVYLQPKVMLQEHKIEGAEALIRWHHPEQGMLAPGLFIPIFEMHRVIHHLDKFVFEEVCRTLARWKSEGKELSIISINLSRQNLDDPDFLTEYYQICQKYDVPAKYIEIELTESIYIDNSERVQTLIEEMHRLGFMCSLDDFGIGYSSLGMLKDLDIDVIKLDRSFFTGNNNSSKGMMVVETIIRLARQLHMQTVAEGIDTQEQADALRALGCDMIQGFIYYRPMPIAVFEKIAFDTDNNLKYLPIQKESDNDVSQVVQNEEASYGKSKIVSFTYSALKDSVLFSENCSIILQDKLYFTNAKHLFETSGFIHPHDVENFKALMQKSMQANIWVKDMIRIQIEEGYYDWINLYIYCENKNDDLQVFGVIVNFKAVREELELWRDKAYRDSLTNLYNRSFLELEIMKMLHNEDMIAIACFDIDDFKGLNEAYGHIIGDQILQYVGHCLNESFRNQDIIVRYGGDQFVVCLPHVKQEVLKKRLEHAMYMLDKPYQIDQENYEFSVSIGAVWYYQKIVSYDQLLQDMHNALKTAKKKGKAQMCIQEFIA